ncbi:uncharacterized protein LOC129753421 [Uranotaenia lowii]|uniref:uncharacterized protein LOC129753421 n=1 Tax=Uranotaenia lowii TaxID=190385 RepID=UPI0024793A9F|nr:uncharacterized protein LOC129753421 [Uranotaenia lowii]
MSRGSKRGAAVSRKVLIFTILFVNVIVLLEFQPFLSSVEARALSQLPMTSKITTTTITTPSSSSATTSTKIIKTKQSGTTSSSKMTPGNLPKERETTTTSANSSSGSGDGLRSEDYFPILVVIQSGNTGSETGAAAIEETLRQEFHQFVQSIPGHEQDESCRRVRFVSWEGMASFERWLSDPLISTVILYSTTTTEAAGDADGDGQGQPTARLGSSGPIGYCDSLSTHLSSLYGKTVLFWPCPRMKQTEKFVPSFETVSMAVRSISQQFNWTEAILYAADTNWALPLALASNLNVPYRIVLTIDDLKEALGERDSSGKAVIICSSSSISSPQTINAINQLKMALLVKQNGNHTGYHRATRARLKILLLDPLGTLFRERNSASAQRFYRALSWPESSSFDEASVEVIENGPLNLLLLTVLTESFRVLLNRAGRGYDFESRTAAPGQVKSGERLLKIRFDARGTLNESEEQKETAWWSMEELQQPLDPEQSTWKRAFGRLINSTNPTFVGCDFHYILNEAYIYDELWSSAEDPERCRALLDSYCSAEEPAVDTGQLSPDVSLDADEDHLNETEVVVSSSADDEDPEERKSLEIQQLCAALSDYREQQLLVLSENPNSTTSDNNSYPFNPSSASSENLLFSEHFLLYEYILAITSTTGNYRNHTPSHHFNFMLLAIKNISSTQALWLPFLNIHHQRHQSTHPHPEAQQNIWAISPIQPEYRNWLALDHHRSSIITANSILQQQEPGDGDELSRNPLEPFWICGLVCWAIIAVAAFVIVSIICASVVFSIAVRNYLIKTRLSKGPNKIVLSPSDFVFPVDMRRVDEGIEAMLCCWLQQLQEFGGPEVEKPDLLKGSIGSLKNLGLPSSAAAASATTAAAPALPPLAGSSGTTAVPIGSKTTAATGSGSETLGAGSSYHHHNPSGAIGALELKARYNGDLVQLKEIPSGSGSSHELRAKAMDLLIMAHSLRHENINPLIGARANDGRLPSAVIHIS